jgi:hypothetical protein
MFESKLVKGITESFPKQYRDKLFKYVFILGYDKLIKKGFLKNFNMADIK